MDTATVYLGPWRYFRWIFLLVGLFHFTSASYQFIQGEAPIHYVLSLVSGTLFFFVFFAQTGYGSSDYYIRADEQGLRIKRQYRRTLLLPWSDIKSISVIENEVQVIERNGKQHEMQMRQPAQPGGLDLRQELKAVVEKQGPVFDIEFRFIGE